MDIVYNYLRKNVLFIVYSHKNSNSQNYIIKFLLKYNLDIVLSGLANNDYNIKSIDNLDYPYNKLDSKTIQLLKILNKKKYDKKFYIKCDDDIFINLYNLYIFVQSHEKKFDLAGDMKHKNYICLQPFIKNKILKNNLDIWISGSFYILSKKVIDNIETR